MADEPTPSAPAAPPEPQPEFVDLDAGESFGREVVPLLRPFKFKGQRYSSVEFRLPTGFDITKNTNPRTGVVHAVGFMTDLCELPVEVFDAMYGGDRTRIDEALGKHVRGVPPTSKTSSTPSGSATPGATSGS